MTSSPRAVVEELIAAQNDHDIEGMLALVSEEYRSETPMHPERNFTGRDGVRKNWVTIFETMPDYRGELLRVVEGEETVWAEVRYTGTPADGSTVHYVGVLIFGIANGQIEWGRIYLDAVESGEATWDEVLADESGDVEAPR